jgi:hypothetical protein
MGVERVSSSIPFFVLQVLEANKRRSILPSLGEALDERLRIRIPPLTGASIASEIAAFGRVCLHTATSEEEGLEILREVARNPKLLSLVAVFQVRVGSRF